MTTKKTTNIFLSVATSALLFTACTSNDTGGSTVTTVTTDSSKMPTTMVTDSTNITPKTTEGAMAPSTTDTGAAKNNKMVMKTGAAKPDATKKGKKGTVAAVDKLNITTTGDMKPDATGVYKAVDYIPSFPGGYVGLQKYFDKNIEYPQDASNEGVEGTVKVNFTIDETGKISASTVEGEQQGYGLDEEALRVINKMPNWNPGKIKGKPVKVNFTLPVKFELR